MVLAPSEGGDGTYHLPWMLGQSQQVRRAASTPPRRARTQLRSARRQDRAGRRERTPPGGASPSLTWGAGMVREKDDDWWSSRQPAGGDGRASTPDSMRGAHGQVLRLADSSAAAAARAEARREQPSARLSFC